MNVSVISIVISIIRPTYVYLPTQKIIFNSISLYCWSQIREDLSKDEDKRIKSTSSVFTIYFRRSAPFLINNPSLVSAYC